MDLCEYFIFQTLLNFDSNEISFNPVPVFYDVTVATVATSDCFVRPAASQVFLPILDC